MLDLTGTGHFLQPEDLTSLVFDLDGTLYFDNRLGQDVNRVASELVAEVVGVDLEQASSLISETRNRITAETGSESTLSLACSTLGIEIRQLHQRFAENIRPEAYLVPDGRVIDLLRTLSERYDLYIYTNNNRCLTGNITSRLGIARFFRDIFTIEYSWRPKPDRSTVELLLSAIDRTPGQCLFVGDRYDVDLRLPASLGCGVYLVRVVGELLNLGRLLNEVRP